MVTPERQLQTLIEPSTSVRAGRVPAPSGSVVAMVQDMSQVLPLRIFLASPGDLEDERAAVREGINEHKARREREGGVAYEIVEWNRVRGTARRPQDAINELIAESHFMMVLFKSAWGSSPGSRWGYTSGTEEELFTGLLELGQGDQPMRDVWVAFVEHPNPDERIVKLRQCMIEQKALLFEQVTGVRDLKQRVTGRLESWEALAATKTPRHVDLTPTSGKDVLRAANLRINGEKLVELGQADAGRASLKEAAVLGGPVELLAYARFLRRTGDLEGAYAETQKAIDHFADGGHLHSALAADAFSAQARVLSAQHRYQDAIGRFETALTLLVDNDAYTQVVRCRIQDDLGIARKEAGDLGRARRDFEAALHIRRDADRTADICQSLINLARLEVAAGDLVTAAGYAEEVIERLDGTPPSGLHANAEVLAAQIRLRQGRPEEGVPHAERALAINCQMANRQGEAIALLLLAQCCRETGRLAEAQGHARACLELNEGMENAYGAGRARWLVEQLAQLTSSPGSVGDERAAAVDLHVVQRGPQQRGESAGDGPAAGV